jgi:AraC-like DNA-binding protein
MAEMDTAKAAPAPALRRFVHQYTGYRYAGFPPGTHLGLPSPYLTLVISLSSPTLVTLDPRRAAAGFSALASGLHTGPAHIEHDGSQFGVQLDLTPAGARALLGVPAAAIARTVVALDDLAGPAAAELTGRMHEAPSWGARFAVLDEVLSRRAGLRAEAPELAGDLWRRVIGSGGTVRVADLARESGWSRRYVAARFAAEFGASPKDVARIARFDRSRKMLQRRDRPVIAEVAAACGFYDQPHLAREWRALAGVSPSAWLASEDLPGDPRELDGSHSSKRH